MKKIFVLCGGNSDEREISLRSGNAIIEALKNEFSNVEKIDFSEFTSIGEFINVLKQTDDFIIFNALHGADGENGKIQALLEMNDLCFTGSGSRTCAITMDKFLTCKIADSIDVPIPKSIRLRSDRIEELPEIEFPKVVKPNDSGSSVATFIIKNNDEYKNAVQQAAQHSKFVLVDQYIEGRELTVTIVNGETYPVVEIRPKNGWYDFTNKYTKGHTEYLVPAPLTTEETNLVQYYALKLWETLDCESYARFDFRFDGKDFYFLEVNTLPGMTALSLTPMAAKANGIDFISLLKKILKL